MPNGPLPTAIVAITLFVAVEITATLFKPNIATYAKAPPGLIATLLALSPGANHETIAGPAVETTATLPVELKCAMYAEVPSGVNATPRGDAPAAKVVSTVLLEVEITETLFVPEFVT